MFPMHPNELRTKLILFFLVTVGFIIFCVRAHAEEGTFNVTCKDGHVAKRLKGNQDAPCRTHGGTVTISRNPKDDEPTVLEQDNDPEDDMNRIAVCADGSEFWSNTKSHRGACKEHGGVTSWDDGTPVKVKRTEYRKVPKEKADKPVRKTIMYDHRRGRVIPASYVDDRSTPRDFCEFSATCTIAWRPSGTESFPHIPVGMQASCSIPTRSSIKPGNRDYLSSFQALKCQR